MKKLLAVIPAILICVTGTSQTRSPNLSLGKIEYSYDANGNPLTANRTSIDSSFLVKLSYSYDSLDRMQSEQYVIGSSTYTMSYLYDNKTNLRRITYPNSIVIDYQRDIHDRVTKMLKGSITVAQIDYDNFDRITGVLCSNGVVTNYT